MHGKSPQPHPGQLLLFEAAPQLHEATIQPLPPKQEQAPANDTQRAKAIETTPWAVSLHDYYISTAAISAIFGDRNTIKTFAPQARTTGSRVQRQYQPAEADNIIAAQVSRDEKNRYVVQEAAWRLIGGDSLLARNKSLPDNEKILPPGDEAAYIYALGSKIVMAFKEAYGGTGDEFRAARAALAGKRERQGVTTEGAIRELWTSERVTAKRKHGAVRRRAC